MHDSDVTKTMLLKIPLEIPQTGRPLVTLLTKSLRSLQKASRANASPLVSVGFLRMLVSWLHQSPESVDTFLATAANLNFLVELVLVSPTVHVGGLAALCLCLCAEYSPNDHSKQSIQSIINQNITIDKLFRSFGGLRQSDQFIAAENLHTEPLAGMSESVLYYDYDFTLFFKELHDRFQRTLRGPAKKMKLAVSPRKKQESGPARVDEHAGVLLQSYKDLMATQETELLQLREQLAAMEGREPVAPAIPGLAQGLQEEIDRLKAAQQQDQERTEAALNALKSLETAYSLLDQEHEKLRASHGAAPDPGIEEEVRRARTSQQQLQTELTVARELLQKQNEEFVALQEG